MNLKLMGLALGGLVFAVNVHAGGWQTLTGADLQSAFADKTIFGKRYVVYYDGKGSMTGKWAGKKYTGRYYFKEDSHYCSRWNEHDSGGEEEGCWTVEKKKDKLRLRPVSGRPTRNQVLKVRDGNTEEI